LKIHTKLTKLATCATIILRSGDQVKKEIDISEKNLGDLVAL